MSRSTPAALIPPERVPLNERLAWSISDAAYACSVSRTTIYALIKQGVLTPSRKFGRPLLDPRQVRRVLFENE